MIALKKITLVITFLALLQSCQTHSPNSLTYTIARQNNYSHIQVNCDLFNLNGDKVFKFNSYLCIFEPNGETIAYLKNRLFKVDQNMKVMWEHNYDLNHQLKRARFHDGYLTIADRFYPYKKGTMRYDQIIVIDNAGKILKSYDFKKYYENNSNEAPWNANNVQREVRTPVYEMTHINSIDELYQTENGKKILNGYIINDRKTMKIYIFDKFLKKIVTVIDLQGRAAHDVRQISEDEIIFYTNEEKANSKPALNDYSYIEIFNIKTSKYSRLWENHNSELISKACSSAQPLESHGLFIFHSSCPTENSFPRSYSVAEIVDLNSKKSQLIDFKKLLEYGTEGQLINAEDFLKNIRY